MRMRRNPPRRAIASGGGLRAAALALLLGAAPGRVSGGGGPSTTHCCFAFGCSADHTGLLARDTARAALTAWLALEGNVTVPAAGLAFQHLEGVGAVVCFGQPAAGVACAAKSRLRGTVATGLTFFSSRRSDDGTTVVLRPHPRTLRGTSSPGDPARLYGDMLATDSAAASNHVSSGAAAGIVFGVLLAVLLLSSACVVALHSPKCKSDGQGKGKGRSKGQSKGQSKGKGGGARKRIQDEDFQRGGGSFQVHNPLFNGT